jgi:hypothetical protein
MLTFARSGPVSGILTLPYRKGSTEGRSCLAKQIHIYCHAQQPQSTCTDGIYRLSMYKNSHTVRREEEEEGLVRWEAGQEPPHQRWHQTLCTPEMHNTACIVPSGLPAIL